MSLESDRRSSGAALETERRGPSKQIISDLNRMVQAKPAPKTLPTLEKKKAIEGKTGVGAYNEKKYQNGGGGIASPLTEEDYTKREYWPEAALSSDGLFNFPALKSITLTDAGGAKAVINLAQPVKPTAP
ncbi:hypothetical protein [Pseudomonas asplenii]|uniref:Uncharacterized protein n=1 Tax=Pseudomonas asplenii TaxID=53407 RepID=A0A1H6NMZ4_9PSED|nr:hypothetical protein [Pseudomonas fuscovaginae]SEI17242.1 hypothetical protein SAMN05216581_3337 [Pseudomonas fuscovaginae]SEI23610.1 hypothetical protein SAMN05216581_5236 [Pseudomonas fuscovaginae]